MPDSNASNLERKIIYNSSIGRGGYATVYEARWSNESENIFPFAVKILNKQSEYTEANKRMNLEISLLSKFSHQNIMKIETYGSDYSFYLMPRYKSSLADIKSQLREEYTNLETILFKVLDGLEYLHNEGIFHRDIKPQNIMLNSYEDVVISDFGLALNTKNDDTRLTGTSVRMGSDFFIAPEQIQDSKNVDQRADIYSFGRLLYYILNGDYDYIMNMDNINNAFHYVINKCVKNKKEERFINISEVKQALRTAFSIINRNEDTNDIYIEINTLNQLVQQEVSDINEIIDIINRINIGFVQQDDLKFEETFKLISWESINRWYLLFDEMFVSVALRYVDVVNETRYPYSEVDYVADTVLNLFELGDEQLKIDIIKCLMSLGYKHNRFYIIRRFFSILEILNPNDSIFQPLLFELSKNKYEMEYCADQIEYNVRKLNSLLTEAVFSL